MNDSNRDLLEAEIQSELEKLKTMEAGSEEYKTTIDGLTKLMDRAINLKKIDVDANEREKDRREDTRIKFEINREEIELKESLARSDNAIKQQQLDIDKKDRIINCGIAIAGLVVPSVITIWGTLKSLKFEETGTVTTIMGRGFINKLLPRK